MGRPDRAKHHVRCEPRGYRQARQTCDDATYEAFVGFSWVCSSVRTGCHQHSYPQITEPESSVIFGLVKFGSSGKGTPSSHHPSSSLCSCAFGGSAATNPPGSGVPAAHTTRTRSLPSASW